MSDAAASPPRLVPDLASLVRGWSQTFLQGRQNVTGAPTAFQRRSVRSTSTPAEVVEAPSRLVQVFANCLLDVGAQSEALALGRCAGAPTVVELHPLLTDVLDLHAPLAASAGVRLSRSLAGVEGILCPTNARLLRLAFSYLTLRALVGEPSPGHVRVTAVLAGGEAHVTLVSRAAAAVAGQNSTSDIAALRRIVQTCGGQLSVAPLQAGYQPLSLVLRTSTAAGLVRAA
jgi:hypothetical protein